MPPTCPVPPTVDPLPHARVNTDGFTFIEVLIALLMAALLAGVASASLSRVARTEGRILRLEEAGLHLQTLATHRTLLSLTVDLHDGGDPDIGPNWKLDRRDVETEQDNETAAWVEWKLQTARDPDPSFVLYEQAPPDPESLP